MKKKVLITGVSGFVGSHLADLLVSQGSYDIFGTYLSERSLLNVEDIREKISLIQINLIDSEKTEKMIYDIQPDYLFHLAALPAVGHSFEKPVETMTNNVTVQINVLEGVRKAQGACRVLNVSSADVYGKVSKEDIPIDEDTPFMPTNTYAVSKIAQDFLGLQYYISFNLPIIRVRPFNHIGPRQASGFVVADFAKRIAEIEKGKIEPVLKVGNTSTRRDFTDVRDMVRAYEILIREGKSGEVYNIGSGVSHEIKKILDILISLATVKIEVETDSHLVRPEDAPERICDNTKLARIMDWQPKISLETTLKDTLDYWRNIV